MCSAGPKSLENQESLDAGPNFPALAPLSIPQMALPPPTPASCAPKGTRTACTLLALPSQEKGLAHGGLQGIHPFSRGWDVEVVYKVTGLPCSCSLEKGWLAHDCLNSIALESKHCLLFLQVRVEFQGKGSTLSLSSLSMGNPGCAVSWGLSWEMVGEDSHHSPVQELLLRGFGGARQCVFSLQPLMNLPEVFQ